jgi:ATP-dependent Lon protease
MRNKKDLIDLPRKARNDLNIITVEHMDEVLKLALNPPKSVPQRIPKKKVSDDTNGGDKDKKPVEKKVRSGKAEG